MILSLRDQPEWGRIYTHPNEEFDLEAVTDEVVGAVRKGLEEHPDIKEAAVIGVPDPIRDQAVKAFVLPEDGASIGIDEVIAYCKGNMAAFKVPSIVEIVEDFPRTCSMKIEKKLLK